MIKPLSDTESREIIQTLLLELDGLKKRVELTSRWLKLAANGPLDLPASDSEKDALFDKALSLIQNSDLASASLLQRKLKIGYARAARILDELQEAGYVDEAEGSKPRKILKRA